MRVSQNQVDQLGACQQFASRRWILVASPLWFAIAAIGLLMTLTTSTTIVAAETATDGQPVQTSVAQSELGVAGDSRAATRHFGVSIRKPSGSPRVATGLTDFHGKQVTVACSTCHATRAPNHQTKNATDLDEFHGELKLSHGTISCLSCHNESDYDALKLADGSRVEYRDVMTLCAQCHGPQMKAYEHGAHGGMKGYWDLTRGLQVKNNCIDCHKPHSPQFPRMQPTFKPKDRFLERLETEH